MQERQEEDDSSQFASLYNKYLEKIPRKSTDVDPVCTHPDDKRPNLVKRNGYCKQIGCKFLLIDDQIDN